MRKMEYWLSRIGIGLLLFGVAFGFKYSIDQGWITPPVRHLIGLALGIVLFVLGLRFYARRRHFAQVLLGGSIGTLYITGFSAFQLFDLVSHSVAFAFMVLVTLCAFFVALKQDDAIFSLIGVIGGLGTPFLLYTGAGNIPGLIGYTCIVLAGTTAVYFFKGWRLLLWTTLVGGWVVLLIGLESDGFGPAKEVRADQWAMQLGALFVWLCFWITPVFRRLTQLARPEKWRKSSLGIGDAALSDTGRRVLERHVHLLSVGSPLVALVVSIVTWPSAPDHFFGWPVAGAAVLYGLAAWYLGRRDGLGRIAFTHATAAIMLLFIALCLLLSGDTLLIVLTAKATALHLVARRLKDKRIAAEGHVLFVVVGVWLFTRLAQFQSYNLALTDAHTITDFIVVATGIAISFFINRPKGLRCYFIAGLIGLGLFLYRQFSGDLLFFLLTLEAAALYLVTLRLRDETIEAVTHGAFGGLGLWLAARFLIQQQTGTVFLNYQSATEAVLIASGFGISRLARSLREKQIYLLLVHVAILALLARELSSLDNGQGFVTISWGIYGAVLLVIGLRKNLNRFRQVALGTLVLMVAKLFLVDLAELETIWRVLLFMGFGAVFLLLSYYFPKLWRGNTESTPD
jgi:uncharacterized membrane protein